MQNTPQILVFYSFATHKSGYIEMLFDRLSERSARHNLALSRGSLNDLHISVRGNKLAITESLTGKNLMDFDTIYFELWYKAQQQALAVACLAEKSEIPYFSKEMRQILPTTKLGELAVLAGNNLPLPESFCTSNKELKKLAKADKLPFAYPFICKHIEGYGGKDNHLVQDVAELNTILSEGSTKTYVLQEFIPNDFDYRLIVLGGRVRFALKRQRSGETHLNNTSQGAEGVMVDLAEIDAKIQADAIAAAKLLNRTEFAGVDVIINSETGQHYILEVNQTPQIEIGAEIEQKMDAMLGYISELAKKRGSNG